MPFCERARSATDLNNQTRRCSSRVKKQRVGQQLFQKSWTSCLKAPFAKAKGLEDASEGVYGAARANWIVLRAPFGAPQDEGGWI